MAYPSFVGDLLSHYYDSSSTELEDYLDDYVENYEETTTPDSDVFEPQVHEYFISHGTFAALYFLCLLFSFFLLKKRFKALMMLKAILLTGASLVSLANAFIVQASMDALPALQEYVRSSAKLENFVREGESRPFKMHLDAEAMLRRSKENGLDIYVHIYILPYVKPILQYFVDFLFHFEQVVSLILINDLRKCVCELQIHQEEKGFVLTVFFSGVFTFMLTCGAHVAHNVLTNIVMFEFMPVSVVLKPFDFVFTLVCTILVFYYGFHVVKSIRRSQSFRQACSSQKTAKVHFLEIYVIGLCLIQSFKTIYLLVRFVLTMVHLNSCLVVKNLGLDQQQFDFSKIEDCFSNFHQRLWSTDLDDLAMIHWASLCEFAIVLFPPLKRIILTSLNSQEQNVI